MKAVLKLKNMEKILFNEKILSGVQLSKAIRNCLKNKISEIKANNPNICNPKLKIILVGERSDSKLYIQNKLKLCKDVGIEGDLKTYPEDIEKQVILDEIDNSNKDSKCHGIIVQLPLPEKINKTDILSHIDINKDVDGLNPLNQGKILQMKISECLMPPTAMGVLEMLRLALEHNNDVNDYIDKYLSTYMFDDLPVDLGGKEVTVLGRGLTAGLPLSILMQKCNGTVTLCHSFTKDIVAKCLTADILVSAVGKPNLVTNDMVKDGCIVIDVGISVLDGEGGKIVGDTDFHNIIKKTKYITPVPGGVGKMTVVMLLKNVVKVWSHANKINLIHNK
jgi:methylenetetrahydrofolate dehydrogenase (NADP+)/methenyltetrahydrofolate cyclohydrolase